MERVFFCNSGTESVESALKFARHFTGRGRILYAVHAFHGLTAGSLSVNGADEFKRGFGPLLPGVQLPLGDIAALEAELKRGDVAAMIIEPVQGHGVLAPPPGYLAQAAALLHKNGALLICDEVQAGLGRTGKFFSYQHSEGVQPDIVTVAKALSGGYVPVGAMLTTDKILRVRLPEHGVDHGPLHDLQGRRRSRWPRASRRWRSWRTRAWWRTRRGSATP